MILHPLGMFTPQLGGHSQHRHRGVVSSVPDLGEGPGGPGPRPPTNRRPPTKPLNFLANDRIDVSLVILIENFEIDEKLCTLAVSFHSLVNLCR